MNAIDLLGRAQDCIARGVLGDEATGHERLGDLVLRPHQREAIARLSAILDRHHGALLADAVGLGKTYVALGLARCAKAPLVVCPSALRGMWESAMALTRIQAPVVTLESLSRGRRPDVLPDFIIIDEAHHFRNPSTRRYQLAAEIASRSRTLLLSATPLHNSRKDLTAVLALFLGSAVQRWPDSELAKVIVRRTEDTVDASLPALIRAEPLVPADDEETLDAICALPVPVPAIDEGTAAALATMSLVHLWSSSRGALLDSLRIRRARAIAMKDAVTAGHIPTSRELSAWHYADGVQQLAFPLFSGPSAPIVDCAALVARLDRYIAAVGSVVARSHVTPNPDDGRAELLRSIRAKYPTERIVAFSQYAKTVIAIGGLMRGDAQIAVLHGEGAHIAHGRITREEILSQFRLASEDGPATERISLLLTTDLLSEGIDLRAASIVVHLDLPWNPARLEQRVGRARRLGSPHLAVHVHMFVPPASADAMLRLRQRIAGKVRAAAKIIGGVPLAFGGTASFESPVEREEELRALLQGWVSHIRPTDDRQIIIAGAVAPFAGWLAVVALEERQILVHARNGIIGDDVETALEVVTQVRSARVVDPSAACVALADAERWVAARLSIALIGAEAAFPSAKRAVLERLALVVTRAPRHHRGDTLERVRRIRASISGNNGIGVERAFGELTRSIADDDAWMRSLESYTGLDESTVASRAESPRIRAMILLAPDPVSATEPAAEAQP